MIIHGIPVRNEPNFLYQMKRIIYLILLIPFLMASCTSTPVEVVEETYSDSIAKTVRIYKDESKQILLKEVQYYENGQMKLEGPFKDGERNGQWSYWYADGKLWSQGVYKNGVENGLKTIWHTNGQKYYEGNLKMGNRIGVWKFWGEEGKLVKEIDYDNIK